VNEFVVDVAEFRRSPRRLSFRAQILRLVMVRQFLWAGVIAASVLEGSGHAGLITYVDRQQWEAAVDQSTMETADFESFTGDVRFVPAPQGVGSVDAGPFSLSANKIVSSSEHLLPNRVDVAPYSGFNNSASNYAYLFVEGDNNLQITLTFDNPVLAFGADFDRVDGGPGESLDLRAITSNGSTTLQAPDPDSFFGFCVRWRLGKSNCIPGTYRQRTRRRYRCRNG
jgi:hypothetical protein